MAESLRHKAFRAFDHRLKFRAIGMRVGIDGFAAFAAGELIDGHAGLAPLDVPQRLVDAADGVVQHRTVLPVGAVVAGLPDVLDPVGGLAQQKRLEIFLHGGLHQVGALGERGAAVAVEAILVGGDLDHGEPHAGGLAFDHADVLDPRRSHAAGGARNLLLRSQEGRGKTKQARTPDRLQQFTTFHLHAFHKIAIVEKRLQTA